LLVWAKILSCVSGRRKQIEQKRKRLNKIKEGKKLKKLFVRNESLKGETSDLRVYGKN